MQTNIYRSLRAAFSHLERTKRRYHGHQVLSRMSDHELDDIGLTRDDIALAIRNGRVPAR